MKTFTNGVCEVRPAEDLGTLASLIKSSIAAAEGAGRRLLEHYRDAGLALIKAKKQCGHGRWLSWLKDHVGIDRMTASRHMRVAREWDKCNTALHLSDALKLIAEDRPGEEEDEPAAAADRQVATVTTCQDEPAPQPPRALAHLVEAGALDAEQLDLLLTLKDVYGADLLRRFDVPSHCKLPLRVPDASAADEILNTLRPEDRPSVWAWRFPYSPDRPLPDCVPGALAAFFEDVVELGGEVPQWEVAACWWACNLVAIGAAPGAFRLFDGPTPWLAWTLKNWQERYEHALGWAHLVNLAGEMHPDDEGDEANPGFRSDLLHSGSLDRYLRLKETDDGKAFLERIIEDISQNGLILPTEMRFGKWLLSRCRPLSPTEAKAALARV
jgi:hypothetical protein